MVLTTLTLNHLTSIGSYRASMLALVMHIPPVLALQIRPIAIQDVDAARRVSKSCLHHGIEIDWIYINLGPRKWKGCNCGKSAKACATKKCSCFRANVECDPEVCISCEAKWVMSTLQSSHWTSWASMCRGEHSIDIILKTTAQNSGQIMNRIFVAT